MTTIILKPDEPVEVALRRFRRNIEKTGLIRELRSRTGYEETDHRAQTQESERRVETATPREAHAAAAEAVLGRESCTSRPSKCVRSFH